MLVKIALQITRQPGVQLKVLQSMKKMGFTCQDLLLEESSDEYREVHMEFDGAYAEQDEISAALEEIRGIVHIAQTSR